MSQRSNNVERRSSQSSVTIPFERTFRNLDQNRPASGTALEQFNFCGCGWPQHMLIPKGTAEGLVVQIFVMVTDYAQDKVSRCVEFHGQCMAGSAPTVPGAFPAGRPG